MNWFIIAAAVFLLVFLYMFLQAILFKTRYYRLNTQAGLRFLHLTDIHIGMLNISACRLRRTIEKTQPDIVLISGDLLDHPKELNKFSCWFRELKLEVPIFCTLGNHDHRCFQKYPSFRNSFFSEMERLGIRILANEVVWLDGKDGEIRGDAGKKVALVGLDDLKTGVPAKDELLLDLKEKSQFVLAFSHNPDIVLRIPEGSVDLLIAGHTHGGQIWMPFNLEYLLLRKDMVSRMGHSKGFSVIRNNRMYISRGLGTVVVPFRFFSVPEVTVFDI